MTLLSVRLFLICSVVAGFSATAAQAETRVPYRARISKSCAAALCNVPSAVVPANRRVELKNVSCVAQTNVGGQLIGAYIYTNPAPAVYHYLTQNWQRKSTFTFSETTGIFATAGQRFIAEIYGEGTTSSFVSCSLYGDLVILP
jgi:hypothetical protein